MDQIHLYLVGMMIKDHSVVEKYQDDCPLPSTVVLFVTMISVKQADK